MQSGFMWRDLGERPIRRGLIHTLLCPQPTGLATSWCLLGYSLSTHAILDSFVSRTLDTCLLIFALIKHVRKLTKGLTEARCEND